MASPYRKGRCPECDYVWAWPGESGDLGQAKCPGDGSVLKRTTTDAATMCTRQQVGLPE